MNEQIVDPIELLTEHRSQLLDRQAQLAIDLRAAQHRARLLAADLTDVTTTITATTALLRIVATVRRIQGAAAAAQPPGEPSPPEA